MCTSKSTRPQRVLRIDHLIYSLLSSPRQLEPPGNSDDGDDGDDDDFATIPEAGP